MPTEAMQLQLRNLKTAAFRPWLGGIRQSSAFRLCIVCSGYEQRAIHWAEASRKLLDNESTKFLVVGFEDFRESLARKDNDAYYQGSGLAVTECSQRFGDAFLSVLAGFLSK